jgi:hypothetical protein
MSDSQQIKSIYGEMRAHDKKQIHSTPLDGRLILSQLVTNSPADVALRYAWANRSLAQASTARTSAILSLTNAPKADLLARRASLLLREKLQLPTPVEIVGQNDLTDFLHKTHLQKIVVKQNYPCKNEELDRALSMDFGQAKIEIANSRQDYDIIESKECLASVATKSEQWRAKNIDRYLRFIFKKNSINLTEDDAASSVAIIISLVSKFLIPSVTFTGSIKDLTKTLKDMLDKDFLPVFKFPYSVSGFGVHYPKNQDGTYNTSELRAALANESAFLSYLTSSLNKDGQIMEESAIAENITRHGIVLQKHIVGHEHSIGYFKPSESRAKDFGLALTDIVVTDVLVEGTGHIGNVLHYDETYIDAILAATPFKGRALLLHFVVEVVLYLMYLNAARIDDPGEFAKVAVEDFGIQFIVDDKSGEIGLIEFNGRTPSCNLNHFHLLSKYGAELSDEHIMPSRTVMFTSARLCSTDDFFKREDELDQLVSELIASTEAEFGKQCELVSLQTTNNNVTVNFGYYIEDGSVNVSARLGEIKQFFSKVNA